MKRILIVIFAILGMVVGITFGESMSNMAGMSWLAIGGEIGFKTPIVLDLNFLQLTIGIWCKINIAGILGLVIFTMVSKKILDWLKI